MAKTLIIVAGDTADFKAQDEATTKFLKKAVVFENYKGGDFTQLKQIGGCIEASPNQITEEFLAANPVVYIQVPHANAVLAAIEEASPRTTLLVVVTKNQLAMEGLGMNSKIGTVSREVSVQDIAATVCYIVDALLPENPTGAIIYQALKDPNLKVTELAKAQQALASMEEAMSRKARNPWDKHDCA